MTHWIQIGSSLVIIVSSLFSIAMSKKSLLAFARSFRASASFWDGHDPEKAAELRAKAAKAERQAWPYKPKGDAT